MLDRVLKIALLYDFYGAMLTEKQQRCLELHYLNDLSLAEIAAEFEVSRQAVHDILRRAEQVLEDYELKLGLVERYQKEQAIVARAYELLTGLAGDCRREPGVKQAVGLLKQLIDR